MCLASLSAACASTHSSSESLDVDSDEDPAEELGGLIQFETFHSAWDGVHAFQITPSVPLAAPDVRHEHAILERSVTWKVDPEFATVEPYPELPGGVLLTMRRSGATNLRLEAQTRAGRRVRDSARVEISEVPTERWADGERRYGLAPSESGIGFDGFGRTICSTPSAPEFPREVRRCVSCHQAGSVWSRPLTPQQTAGYSDAELIAIFTTGKQVAESEWTSVWLQEIGDEATRRKCYIGAHTWEVAAETQQGIVLRLRGMPPVSLPEVDRTRLGVPD